MTSKTLINAVVGALASGGLPANRLILEITESVFLQKTSANLATMKSLHELGVRFSMDDFGTGYSSLGYLMSFPFSKIKIDRSFIAGLREKQIPRHNSRYRGYGRKLGMRVIAEGVETAEQREQTRMLGCTDMQGYLISVPRPAVEIRRLFLGGDESVVGVTSIESSRKAVQLPHPDEMPRIPSAPPVSKVIGRQSIVIHRLSMLTRNVMLAKSIQPDDVTGRVKTYAAWVRQLRPARRFQASTPIILIRWRCLAGSFNSLRIRSIGANKNFSG